LRQAGFKEQARPGHGLLDDLSGQRRGRRKLQGQQAADGGSGLRRQGGRGQGLAKISEQRR